MRRIDGCLEHTLLAQRIDQQQYIAGLSQRLHLPGKHLLDALMGSERRHQRAVGRQRQCRQTRAIAFEAADEGRAEVPGQGRTAAQTSHQQLAACSDAADQRLDRLGNRTGQALCGLVLKVSAVEELLLNALFEHGHGSYDTARAHRFRRSHRRFERTASTTGWRRLGRADRTGPGQKASKAALNQLSSAPSMATTSNRQGGSTGRRNR